jgi:hypothetical protein
MVGEDIRAKSQLSSKPATSSLKPAFSLGKFRSTIFPFKESLDKNFVDVSEKVPDRFVLHHRPFRSYGTLKDTNTLRILVKDGLNIFCSPQGILRSLTSVDKWNLLMSELTFLNQISKLALRTGIKGTGFCPGCCKFAKK